MKINKMEEKSPDRIESKNYFNNSMEYFTLPKIDKQITKTCFEPGERRRVRTLLQKAFGTN